MNSRHPKKTNPVYQWTYYRAIPPSGLSVTAGHAHALTQSMASWGSESDSLGFNGPCPFDSCLSRTGGQPPSISTLRCRRFARRPFRLRFHLPTLTFISFPKRLHPSPRFPAPNSRWPNRYKMAVTVSIDSCHSPPNASTWRPIR